MKKSRTDRVLGGVCGGLAERYNIDSFWIRFAFVFIFLWFGFGLLVYLLAWIFME